jgi:PAS domain S-box-containing protein
VEVSPKNLFNSEFARALRRHTSVPFLCVIFLAVLWSGLWLHLKLDRERTLAAAESENDRLVRIFEEHVMRTIRAADITLRQIESEYARLGSKLEVDKFVTEREVSRDPYSTISILDENGTVVVSNLPVSLGVNFSKNDNVRYHREHDTQELFFSTPRLGTTSKKWSVFLSHRINKLDGSHGGNSSLALDPFYFTNFYGDLDLGRGSVVTLFGRDGIARARLAEGKASAGSDVSKSTLFTHYLPSADHGHFRESSGADGVFRLYSYGALKDYPLVVGIGASQSVVLAPYVARREVYLGAFAGVSGVILLLGYFIVIQQISQTRTDNHLRESEERFKAFMDHSPAIAFIKDENGRYVYVNKPWEDRYALDWRGKTDAELWPRDQAKMFEEGDLRALGTGEALESFENVPDKDGRPRDLWVMKFPLVDSAGNRLLSGMALDITERKQAEDALRAARDELEQRVEERTAELTRSNALLREKDEYLTLAQRAAHTGLWSRDFTTGNASMSPEWYDLMGFALEKANISHAEVLDRVHPDDRRRIAAVSLLQDNSDFANEFRIFHPSKGERWMLSMGRKGMTTVDGHSHMMGALIDITERKASEEALRQSETRLRAIFE